MKKLTTLSLIVAAAVAALIFFSPFHFSEKFGYRCVATTVEIAAPPDSVFAFLGDSKNATQWSVFVHHIITLNSEAVPDGQVGSLRRCFAQADEQGIRWDEEILIADPGKKRRLTCYDLRGFSMSADGLATDQIYEPLPGGGTRLTFTVFFLKKPSLWTMLKTYLAGYKINSVFEQNLLNIKRLCEKK